MDVVKEIGEYLRARYTLVLLRTAEEQRALEIAKELGKQHKRPVFAWDLGDGFSKLYAEQVSQPETAREPQAALQAIDRYSDDAIFVLLDFHDCWANPQVRRKLRTLAHKLAYTRKSLIVTGPPNDIPAELRDEAVLVDLPPPDRDQLEGVLERLLATPGVSVSLDDDGRNRLLEAAKGLSLAQARRVFGLAIVRDGTLDSTDIDLVTAQKRLILRDSEALEFVPASVAPDDVGGLHALKDWLRLRQRAFGTEAREFGLPVPRGVALIGIPGTGKSLSAKMIAGAWELPLVRLDIGAIFGSLVGESESRVRRALAVAEAVSPCVLWIDEIEKGLAHGGGDSGTSTRVFGTVLTWMQEKTAGCFVVATANDVSALPPELLRRGRFDEVFFLDLPDQEERQAILEVHLRKRGRDLANFGLDTVVGASEGFVGAELEQALIDAMYQAFDHDREVTTEDLLGACRDLVPMAVSQRERIDGLRSWLAEGRARSASHASKREAEAAFVVPALDFPERG